MAKKAKPKSNPKVKVSATKLDRIDRFLKVNDEGDVKVSKGETICIEGTLPQNYNKIGDKIKNKKIKLLVIEHNYKEMTGSKRKLRHVLETRYNCKIETIDYALIELPTEETNG